MTLEQLLEQIKLFVEEVRTLKEEKEAAESNLEPFKNQISALELENALLNEQILSLNAEKTSLEEQANLNLAKAREIVDELKALLSGV